ncbi:MAG: hypothetical protein ACRDID_22995 [Ktedonobacterales bacterium]
MFDIVAELTPQSVLDALHRRVPLWGLLFLRFSDSAFPDEGWSDCISVCLPKWLADARTLTHGLMDEIHEEFMDENPRFSFDLRLSAEGPVALTCREEGRQAVKSIELPLRVYTAALARAGRSVLHQVEPLSGPTYPLVEELKRAIAFFAN